MFEKRAGLIKRNQLAKQFTTLTPEEIQKLKTTLLRQVEKIPNSDTRRQTREETLARIPSRKKVIEILFTKPGFQTSIQDLIQESGFTRTEIIKLFNEMDLRDGIGILDVKNKMVRINPETLTLNTYKIPTKKQHQ